MTPKGDHTDDVDSGVTSSDDEEEHASDTDQDELVTSGNQISSKAVKHRKPKNIQEEGGVKEKGYLSSLFNPFGYLNYYTSAATVETVDDEN